MRWTVNRRIIDMLSHAVELQEQIHESIDRPTDPDDLLAFDRAHGFVVARHQQADLLNGLRERADSVVESLQEGTLPFRREGGLVPNIEAANLMHPTLYPAPSIRLRDGRLRTSSMASEHSSTSPATRQN